MENRGCNQLDEVKQVTGGVLNCMALEKHSKRARHYMDNNILLNVLNELKFPSAKSWCHVNFDVDFAKDIATEIISQSNILKVNNIKVSASDYYLAGPLIRLLKNTKNFATNIDFKINLKDISEIMFGSSSQKYVTKVRKLLQIFSLVKVKNSGPLWKITSRQGSITSIKFNSKFNDLFNKFIDKKDHTFVKIPRERVLEKLSSLIKTPTAFCLFLELYVSIQKEYLFSISKNTQPSALELSKESKERLNAIFTPHGHHSITENIHAGEKQLQNKFSENFKSLIKDIAVNDVETEEIQKYKEVIKQNSKQHTEEKISAKWDSRQITNPLEQKMFINEFQKLFS